jgi:hypothetical protein
MEIPLQYAYLFVTGVFGLIWALYFWLYPETRKTQFLISLLASLLGPLIELLYTRDYWHPVSVFPINFGFFSLFPEDMLFAFFFTGMVGMFAHVSGEPAKNLKLDATRMFLMGIALAPMLLAIPIFWLGANSILATSAGFLLVVGMAVERKLEICRYAFRCGLLTAIVMFVTYLAGSFVVTNSELLLQSLWLLYGKPLLGIRLLGAPMVWLIWGFSFGAMVGAVRHRIFA